MKWFGLELAQAHVFQVGLYIVVGLLIASFFQQPDLKCKFFQIWSRFRKTDPLIRAGGWATGFFLVAVLVLFGFETCVDGLCETKFQHFISGTSNEVGDTLAGLAGSLAFLWIIVTVLLQGKELQDQRSEFKKMASAQEEQVKLLVVQGEILKKEQEEREKEIHARHLDSLLEALRNSFEELSFLGNRQNNVDLDAIFSETQIDSSIDTYCRDVTERIVDFWEKDYASALAPLVFAECKREYYSLFEVVVTIDALHDHLEIDRRQRLRNMRFQNLHAGITKFNDDGYLLNNNGEM